MIENQMKKLWNKLFGWRIGEKVRATTRNEEGDITFFAQGHIKQVIRVEGQVFIQIDVGREICLLPESFVEKGWINHTPKKKRKK